MALAFLELALVMLAVWLAAEDEDVMPRMLVAGLLLYGCDTDERLPTCQCPESFCSSREVCYCDGQRCSRSLIDAPAPDEE